MFFIAYLNDDKNCRGSKGYCVLEFHKVNEERQSKNFRINEALECFEGEMAYGEGLSWGYIYIA